MGRIASLDGLRAVSIALVVVGHAWSSMRVPEEFAGLERYLGNADLGVRTFFVLSGYLITLLLRKEIEASGTIRLRDFYARRIIRIFPAFYAYLAVIVVLRAFDLIQTTYPDIAVAGAFLTNNKDALPIAVPTNAYYWYVGHFWTIALEEQFYLFWPAVLGCFGLRVGGKLAFWIVFAQPLLRVLLYFALLGSRGQTGMMLVAAADPIMCGCLVALLQGNPRFEALFRRFGHPAFALAAIAFLFAVNPWLDGHFRVAYSTTVGLTLNAFAIAYVLAWVVRNPNSLPARILSNPVIRHIGVLSYSLYLWQQLFLAPRNEKLPWTGSFPLNLILCFAAAEFSYWLIERPVLRLRHRFRSGGVTAPSTPVPVPESRPSPSPQCA